MIGLCCKWSEGGRVRRKKEKGSPALTPPPLSWSRSWLYSGTTNGLSPPTGWLGRSLYSLAYLLTGYIIHSTSQAARLLFFYLILFAFVTGLAGLALLTNSLSWRAPLPSYARYVGGTRAGRAASSGWRRRLRARPCLPLLGIGPPHQKQNRTRVASTGSRAAGGEVRTPRLAGACERQARGFEERAALLGR
jgi:hypothetical protein